MSEQRALSGSPGLSTSIDMGYVSISSFSIAWTPVPLGTALRRRGLHEHQQLCDGMDYRAFP